MTEQEELKEMCQHLRNAYSSPSGRVAFHSLLMKGVFFDDINSDNTEMIGRNNMAKEIIRTIAYTADPYDISMMFLDALLGQPIYEERKAEDE